LLGGGEEEDEEAEDGEDGAESESKSWSVEDEGGVSDDEVIDE
jgi:hypothetical protein